MFIFFSDAIIKQDYNIILKIYLFTIKVNKSKFGFRRLFFHNIIYKYFDYEMDGQTDKLYQKK